ncbi:type II toxin-antitoxin system VapC family toxin [Halobaculum sp. EA56]|uniref:type II toxin-antitoxin system VapC family toxin n=1 Tax=Halobaculum sp. EA56 TaxID=3421648 RepID=UPI003EB6B6A7
MRLFLDTNVFVAAVLAGDDDEATGTAMAVLNGDHEFLTSLVNLMELRSVLTKKRRLERDRADAIEEEIRADVEVVVPDAGELIDAYRIQDETLLYPVDSLILACARRYDATLVSFDGELVDAGAEQPTDVPVE